MSQTTDPVPFNNNSYVAFDGTSIRDIIINRLNQGQVFSDQNYQGSNLSALIDIVSYTFNTLLYYLNKTSSESMFSQSQVYENMNRIVKLLGYNPIGRLGQNVAFNLNAISNLPIGNYFIPRYSYVNVGGTFFSVNQDVAFSKLTTANETINDVNNNYLLHQGLFQEYPLYSAAGIDNEVIYLALNNVYIDHFNIDVYVKPNGQLKWQKWSNVPDLFTYNATDTVYVTRFNENQLYEISFGDGVNGVKLNAGDQVAIYYLAIDPNAVGISSNALNSTRLVPFNSVQYANILTDTSFNLETLLTSQQFGYINLSNDYPSNVYTNFESVDQIRQKAPEAFRSQFRLITITDYQNYINSNFANIVANTSVVNNNDYLTGHLKYLYDIGLNQPQLQNQVLLNQIKFSSSCNFNNVYVYAVPNNSLQKYLSPPQKELIINGINSIKTITSNIVVIDPVYMNLDFFAPSPIASPAAKDVNLSTLQIIQSPTSGRASSGILNDVIKVFNNTFNINTSTLGQTIDIYQLTSELLNIDGVQAVQTYRSDTNTSVAGVSLLVWNQLYPEQDATVHSQNLNLEYFQYPIFNNISNLGSRIQVLQPIQNINPVDF